MSRTDSPLPGDGVELQDIAIGHGTGTAGSGNHTTGVPSTAGGANVHGGQGQPAALVVDNASGSVDDGAPRTLAGRLRRGCAIVGPPWVKNIVLCETCERFGYYGLRAVLVLYLNEGLGYSESTSVSLFSYASAMAYAMSLLGGVLSDSFLGKYKTILYCTIVYCFGSALLAITSGPRIASGAFLALFLISIGTGGIKPCVSTFGADQFSAPGRPVVSKAQYDAELASFFMVFYFGINVGAMGSQIMTPILRHYVGYVAAFGLPSCLLAVSGLVLWSARDKYYVIPPQGSVLVKFYRTVRAALKVRAQQRLGIVPPLDNGGDGGADGARAGGGAAVTDASGLAVVPSRGGAGGTTDPVVRKRRSDSVSSTGSATGGPPRATAERLLGRHEPRHHFLDYARDVVGQVAVDDMKAVWAILPIFAVLPAFWMCYDQQGSSWTLQAKHMNTYGLEPEQIQSLNTFLIILFVPICDKWLYPKLRNSGVSWLQPHPLRRMPLGMLISASSFYMSFLVQLIVDSSEKGTVSVLLQVPGYILMTIGEVLVSITGIEFAYSEAPASMKGSIMAFYYLTVAIGDLLTGFVFNILSFLPIRWIFFVFASLMVAAFFIFIVVARRYRRPVRQSPALAGLDMDQQPAVMGGPDDPLRGTTGGGVGGGKHGAGNAGTRAASGPAKIRGRGGGAGVGRQASKYQQLGDDEA